VRSPFSESKRRFTLGGIDKSLAEGLEFKGTFRQRADVHGGVGQQGSVFAPMYQDLLYNNIAQYQIPRNKKMHNRLMSQIYHFDPVAGPAVDLYADFPWSSFDITGVEDPAVRHIYEDALNNLKLEYYLPQITANFLVYGKICLHFLFDKTSGVWTNFIFHNDDDIDIVPVPFFNEDPLINFIPSPELREFFLSKDPRIQIYKQRVSPEMIKKITSGNSIPLDSSNTLYLPRRVLNTDTIGTSLYARIIGLITLERALMNASTAKAQRSAGPIRLLKMGRAGGVEGWIPKDEEIQAAISSIMMAEEDPVASVVAFKTPDATVELMPGSGSDGLWKISEEYDFIQSAKFKALGISEAMLSGEATYNNMEQALSVFLERIKTMRDFMTRKILVEKVFEPLAKAHGFYNKKKVLNPRVKSGSISISDSQDSNLILPTINWHKVLEPRMDQSLIELYEKAEEVGLPVTLRDWGKATGISLNNMDATLQEDLLDRKKIKVYKDKLESAGIDSEAGGGSGSGDIGGDFGADDLGGDSGGGDEGGDTGGGEISMEPAKTPEPGKSVVDGIPPPPPTSVQPRNRVRIDKLEQKIPDLNILSGV
jgi:hypothetical protein